MPSEAPVLPTQPEKPHHYTYLKEFRTQQCPLFLQHKCTQHRPFTCFHWHFMNQRRRRPIRKRDGTFSYSPDIYCTKFDETTGICQDGDDCPFLHRTAGDTERRYHLRYYKTGTCVYETDAKGCCVKNGPHCAFAHGAQDLRAPVYDIRELQNLDQPPPVGPEKPTNGSLGSSGSLEKDKILTEDPRWNDTNFVLANYKTEQCKRPPRLCRQGYACPQFHNTRDRRRSPKVFKYRSTPCPNVKHGDDWGDPSVCEAGDNCPYCHTRTEQQFHPEIYKSTKCNDMVQTGYCPRGSFCAFAHVEQEMVSQRDIAATTTSSSLAAFLPNELQKQTSIDNTQSEKRDSNLESSIEHQDSIALSKDVTADHVDYKVPAPIGKERADSSPVTPPITGQLSSPVFIGHGVPGPIGKGRSSSTSSSISTSDSGFYQRTPGIGREDTQPQTVMSQAKLRQQLQAIENDPSLDTSEKAKRKQNLILIHTLNGSNSSATPNNSSVSSATSTMSPLAPPFFPPGDTVESVIGNALEDLNLEDFDLSSIDKELEKDNDNNSVCSSISAGFSSNYLGSSSGPVNIPDGGVSRGSAGSLDSPVSSLGSLPPAFVPQQMQLQQKQEQQLEQAAAAFLSQPNPGKYHMPGFSDYTNNSPRSSTGGALSPLVAPSPTFSSNSEMHRLREELMANKSKLHSWEEGISQARSACDAWKKEAEESLKKAKIAEAEKLEIMRQRDEALGQVVKLTQEVERLNGGPFLHCLKRINELENLPIAQLKNLQTQLRLDLDRLDKIVYQYTAMKCLVCQDKNRSVAVMPCNHYVLCDSCSSLTTECPYCHAPITQRSSIVLPL
ncbi:RING finger protein unkempt homolog [Lingula anatina]|uniref:RING finger protein unkempt homolog n=1 Tax=Lingula anatina TaxID=7574 RepID=A0A1S3IJK3_LINAN|nr:RING finger protein unkempt homolog [Lingula anatina]|eukprot:XP_013398420.1 RING finger protein unkempt homolog [Lingula anatina]